MKQLSTGLCALALLSLMSTLAPAQAHPSRPQRKTEGLLHYDMGREVTLSGTIASIVRKHTAGTLMGSHLLLTTVTGPVDASLGRFALQGKGALPVVAGQQVGLTGVMKTVKGKQVFLVRTVRSGSTTYAIRNGRGMLISPQARQRASHKSSGEAL